MFEAVRRPLLGSAVCALALLTIVLMGCGSKEPEAKGPKYRPAGTNGGSDEAKSPDKAKPSDGAPSDAPAQAAADARPGAKGARIADTPDGAITVPNTNDTAELWQFMQELETRQPRGLSRSQQLEDYQLIQNARLTAAERILAGKPSAKMKLEVLQAMQDIYQSYVQFEVPGAKQNFHAFAQSMSERKDEDLALFGRLMLFQFRVEELMAESPTNGEMVVDEIQQFLEKHRESNSIAQQNVLRLASMAADALEQSNQPAAAAEAIRLIATELKNNADPQLSEQAPLMEARAKLAEAQLQKLATDLLTNKDESPEKLITAIKSLLTGENPSVAFALDVQRIAQVLEISGNNEAAREIYGMLQTSYGKHENSEVAQMVSKLTAKGVQRLDLIGKPFELAGVDAEGKPLDWASYRGKVVLVDFWATSVGPSLEEIPLIRQALSLYKEKGFEVVGMNLDVDIANVEQFQSIQSLPWPNYFSQEQVDKKPFANWSEIPIAGKYGIDALPFRVLVDKEGNVDSLHLRGPRLQERLKALLGEPARKAKPPAIVVPDDPDSGEPARLQSPADEPATPPTTEPAPGESSAEEPSTETAPQPAAAETPAADAPTEQEPAPPSPAPSAEPKKATAEQFLSVSTSDFRSEGLQRAPALQRNRVVLTAADEQPVAETPGDQDAAPPAINPYLAKPNLSVAELEAWLEKMLDKPKTIQSRAGFAEAVADGCDRLLAAQPPASDAARLMAIETKLRTLHQAACADSAGADKQLQAAVEQFSTETQPKVVALVNFYRTERKALDSAATPVDQTPQLLSELQDYFAAQKLGPQYLRMASATVATINRLTDGDAREGHFEAFGKLFAASSDKELARYGRKLAKKPAVKETDLLGKPLEIVGTTSGGLPIDWKSYRGKVVVVDFWATWCPPCVRELPNVKAAYEQHKDQGFEVLGISLDKDQAVLAEFLQQHELPWPTLAGDDTEPLATKYGVRGIPTLMLVDKAGLVVAVAHNIEQLAPQIEKLLERK